MPSPASTFGMAAPFHCMYLDSGNSYLALTASLCMMSEGRKINAAGISITKEKEMKSILRFMSGLFELVLKRNKNNELISCYDYQVIFIGIYYCSGNRFVGASACGR